MIESPILSDLRQQKRRDLISGLLGVAEDRAEDHGYLYNTDAVFRAQVTALADMLPSMVEGMAARARDDAEQREREIILLMEQPPLLRPQSISDGPRRQ